MDLGLQGKCALVTGGAMGIGAAIALGLAREGCEVAVIDRRQEEAEGIAGQIRGIGRRALAITADVARHEEALRAVATVAADLGRLDILVCSAGITWDGVIWKMSEEQWDSVVNVNLKGCFNYSKAAAQVFKEQRSGKIVHISSINGLRGKFGQTNYSASKGGVIALSKSLARELGRYNVNVNVIAPGMVMTEMARNTPPELVQKAVDETLLGRLATPEECADAVVFLCSERARHITGQVIQVDGGQYL